LLKSFIGVEVSAVDALPRRFKPKDQGLQPHDFVARPMIGAGCPGEWLYESPQRLQPWADQLDFEFIFLTLKQAQASEQRKGQVRWQQIDPELVYPGSLDIRCIVVSQLVGAAGDDPVESQRLPGSADLLRRRRRTRDSHHDLLLQGPYDFHQIAHDVTSVAGVIDATALEVEDDRRIGLHCSPRKASAKP
jgi:hypothetical protein